MSPDNVDPVSGVRFLRGKSVARAGDPSSRRSQTNELNLSASRHDKFVDDLTGLPLNPELCKAARRKELDYFESKSVWVLRKIS